MKKSTIICILLGICLILGMLLIRGTYSKADDVAYIEAMDNDKIGDKNNRQDEKITLRLVAVGDIMTHGPQIKAHYDKATDTYDFEDDYKYVKGIIKGADMAICNIETTFAGEKKGYSSYPAFNTPDALVDALLYSGFNMASTANNHSMDTGKKGFLRTLELLTYKKLPAIGTHLDGERNFKIFYKNGLKIGLTAYTYETEKLRGNKTVNGLIIPEELEDNINTFHYGQLDESMEAMKSVIEEIKALKVDLIIFYMHWGNEYHTKQNKYQEKIGAYLSEEGVDVIFGSHPHVVQPIEIIKNSKGEETVVFYSLGNFISNQRYELSRDRHTEDGLIGEVTYEFDVAKGEVTLKGVKATPTWVNKYYTNNGYKYEIIPLPIGEEQMEGLNQNEFWKANNSYRDTMAIIGEEYLN